MGASSPYDIDEFIYSIIDLNMPEMIKKSEFEAERIRVLSYNIPGARDARNQGSKEYYRQLIDLLRFLRTQRFPGGQSDLELSLYQKIARKLIVKEQWLPGVLEEFD